MEQVIILILIIAAWLIGWKMKKAESDMIIGYRDQQIKDQKAQIEWYDKWTDTLFNEDDMRMSFMKGITTCPWQSTTYPLPDWDKEFDKWIEMKYKPVEQVTEQTI